MAVVVHQNSIFIEKQIQLNFSAFAVFLMNVYDDLPAYVKNANIIGKFKKINDTYYLNDEANIW